MANPYDNNPQLPRKKPRVKPLETPGQYDATQFQPTTESDNVTTFTRLLVGAGIEGFDQLLERLQEIEKQLLIAPVNSEPASDFDKARQTVIGLMFVTQAWMREGLAKLGTQLDDFSKTAKERYQVDIEPYLANLPFYDRIEEQLQNLEQEIDHWQRIGALEEQRGRAMAQATYFRIVDEVIDYLAEKPEITQLIQQQSIGVVGGVMDDVRTVSAQADNLTERIARGILRRRQRQLRHVPTMNGDVPMESE